MNVSDDWARWGESWQQQATPDGDDLERRMRRKRRRMRAAAALEILAALLAVVQLLRLLWLPGVGVRWTAWAIVCLALVAELTWLRLRARRGTWRAASASVPDLLRLSARRARVGLRLAWLDVVGFAVLLAVTVVAAWPWLAPSRWLHDPALRHLLVVQIGIGGLLLLGLIVFLTVFVRRQKQRLRHVQALLRDYTADPE